MVGRKGKGCTTKTMLSTAVTPVVPQLLPTPRIRANIFKSLLAKNGASYLHFLENQEYVFLK